MANRVKEAIYNQVVFERRILFVCTGMVLLSVVLWTAAISTDHWFSVIGGENGIYVNHTQRYFLKSNSGIWRICRTSYSNSTRGQGMGAKDGIHNATTTTTTATPATNTTTAINVTTAPDVTTATVIAPTNATATVPGKIVITKKCRKHEMFPSESKVKNEAFIDYSILDYNRTEASFSIISLLLLLMGLAFSIYTFRNPRYTFKRLAGGIHFLASACVLCVIEVTIISIDYEQKNLPFVFPSGATYSYGYSIFLAWLVFVMVLFSGCSFMIFSRKRKGSRAPTEEMGMADEPTIIGR